MTDAPQQDDSRNAVVQDDEDVFKIVYRLFDDLQKVRIGHNNRVEKAMPKIPPHITPPRGYKSWKDYFSVSADVFQGEEDRILPLAERLLRNDPLGQWLIAQRGIGPALGVSILGETKPLNRFQNVQKLWAYAGLHVVNDKDSPDFGKAVRRKTGVKSNWNQKLKTRMWIFSDVVIKVGGPWRTLYDQRKEYEYGRAGLQWPPTPKDEAQIEEAKRKSLERKEERKAAKKRGEKLETIVTPNSPLMIHKRSLRYIQKMLLKDLWRVAHNQPALIGIIQQHEENNT